MDDDPWAWLPTDLLLVIFLSLEPTAVLRCAGVCKPWRRTIIGNASILGPHLELFGRSSLLLGVFHNTSTNASLRRRPGLFQSVLPWNVDGDNDHETAAAAQSLIPAASGASSGVDRGLYNELLCCKDGFILLMARTGVNRSLCLCNPITGDCTFLPSAARGRYSTYFLLTSYDDDDLSPSIGTGNKLVPRILAVHTRTRYKNFGFVFKFKAQVISYQIFSTSGDNAGKWGPVKRSVGEFKEGLSMWMDRWTVVVCGHVAYWLAGPEDYITCVLALDAHTGWTWTTELPKQRSFLINGRDLAMLALSSDGRLSFMDTSEGDVNIKIWVLTGDAGASSGWSLHQTISIDTECMISGEERYCCAFCTQSQCMVAVTSESGHEFLVDLGTGSSCPPVIRIGNIEGFDCCPYEIDSSATYISKMKNF